MGVHCGRRGYSGLPQFQGKSFKVMDKPENFVKSQWKWAILKRSGKASLGQGISFPENIFSIRALYTFTLLQNSFPHFYHSFILHHLENRVNISTPYDGRCWSDSRRFTRMWVARSTTVLRTRTLASNHVWTCTYKYGRLPLSSQFWYVWRSRCLILWVSCLAFYFHMQALYLGFMTKEICIINGSRKFRNQQ